MTPSRHDISEAAARVMRAPQWATRIARNSIRVAGVLVDGQLEFVPTGWLAAEMRQPGYALTHTNHGTGTAAHFALAQQLRDLGFRDIRPDDAEFDQALQFWHDTAEVRYDVGAAWRTTNQKDLLARRKEFAIFLLPAFAFDLFDAQGMPARFEPSTKYDVLHPETGAPYPPKAIWHLHCGEPPGFAMNQSLRDRMLTAGFTVVLKSDSAQVALSPQDLAVGRPGDETYTEGAERQITRNIRERDPNARAACIAHYRAIHDGRLPCVVCDLDFGEAYGDLGAGYIHVHHLDPLSESQGARSVSPTTDLVPVCPNCHAMIHLGGQTRSIAEVRDILRKTP